jgi:hypothetical protein
MEKHPFRITKTFRISNYANPELIKELLDDYKGNNDLPISMTGKYYRTGIWEGEKWIKQQIEKGFSGILFVAKSPIVRQLKSGKRWYWGYHQEKLLYAESITEAELKAQEFADSVYNEPEKNITL